MLHTITHVLINTKYQLSEILQCINLQIFIFFYARQFAHDGRVVESSHWNKLPTILVFGAFLAAFSADKLRKKM